MKILSINSAKTTDENNVALNVDAPPEPGVMERVKYGTLRVRFEDGLLWIRAPSEDGGLITARTIQNLQSKIDEATAEVQESALRAKEDHERALKNLAVRTGLPVD